MAGLGLAEAYGLIQSAPTAETGRLDWEVVVQQLLLSREGRRETTWRDLRTRMARTLEVLQATPRPRDGRSLMGGLCGAAFRARAELMIWSKEPRLA